MPTNHKRVVRPSVRRPFFPPLRPTLADYVAVGGQRLRADEAASIVTFQLFYAAKRTVDARQGGTR